MNYGTPYQGSKSKIAKWVVNNLPSSTNFYDLFAGGCAVTHAALLSGKYINYYANDIWTAPKLFLDAINGKYKNETRWISREEFFEKRLIDPYIQFCWSFGNGGKSYMFSKKIEPWKKALHYAIVFRDYSLIDTYDIRLSKIIDASTIHKRRLNCKKNYGMLYKIIPSATLLKDLPYKYTPKCNPTNTVATHKDICDFLKIPYKKSLQRLEILQNLESLQSLERLENIKVSQTSYENVLIKPNSVIYCDIPYRTTSGYNFKSCKKSDKNDFDYETFYKWCKKQKELVIVSEYSMPDDFICVNQIEKTVCIQGGNKNKAAERLFVPRHQIELYNSLMQENKKYKDSDFVQSEFDFMSA